MSILRKWLVKGVAGAVVITGVGSLILLGIMAGVKVAYAADSHPIMANDESSELHAINNEKIETGYLKYP
jgi:hypothetical protein